MLKNAFHPRSKAEALSTVCMNGVFSLVVRFAVVVLISILITPIHAEPV